LVHLTPHTSLLSHSEGLFLKYVKI
jgi:hypothetical protein